jgi:hypothetical protein
MVSASGSAAGNLTVAATVQKVGVNRDASAGWPPYRRRFLNHDGSALGRPATTFRSGQLGTIVWPDPIGQPDYRRSLSLPVPS